MREYYFANCRLRMDDEIADDGSMSCLSAFSGEMPYEHTFTLRLGDAGAVDEVYQEALKGPVVSETTGDELRRLEDGWRLITKPKTEQGLERARQVLVCGRDYRDMTLYCAKPENGYYTLFKTMLRVMSGVGRAFAGGITLHASLVEKDGYGVLFTGPSGMGKSTQARLWERYQGAEIINGDSPAIYERDGAWYASGLPCDGKDDIYKQRELPIKAVIVLEQAKENHIRRVEAPEAMAALLQLVMYPFWDDEAMDRLSAAMFRCASAVPFYHLKNLPEEAATILTHRTINEKVI